MADKSDLKAVVEVDGATTSTIAVLPSHTVCDFFVRASHGAVRPGGIHVLIDQVHVKATTSDV